MSTILLRTLLWVLIWPLVWLYVAQRRKPFEGDSIQEDSMVRARVVNGLVTELWCNGHDDAWGASSGAASAR